MENKILFCDQVKQERLREAIRLGFIHKVIDPDGVVRYFLTDLGRRQWAHEHAQNLFK